MRLKTSFVFLLQIGSIALAQSNRATIGGTVRDSQGAAVPGAEIVALDIETGVRSAVKTNGAGAYLIPNLAIDRYTLTVERQGFRKYVRSGLALSTSEVLGLDIVLEIGSIAETVDVVGSAPLLETRTSDFTQLIESKSIEDLPLGNRKTLNIIQMTGAAVFVADDIGGLPTYSLAGGRMQSQMVWIDGGSGQNMRLGVGQQNVDPPVDTIEEIKVLSNNYSAEYGGSAGGVVIETTKSGTNRLHGSAYEFLRNNKLDAPGYFAPVQNGVKVIPQLRYNVFGGTAGGRIRRDKTFYFVSYEGQRRRLGSTTTLTVPTNLQRTGDFSQTFDARGALVPIYDPTTTQAGRRTQFPGNTIAANRLDPVALNVLKYYPIANRAPDSATGANNFRANSTNALTGDFLLGKIDHSFTDRDKFTGRYLFSRTNTTVRSVYPDAGADPTGISQAHSQYWYGSWTRVQSASMVNDLRFTYTNRVGHALTLGIGGGYPSKLGVTGVDENAFPQFAPAGFSPIGSAAQERRQYPIEQQQFVDNVSFLRGRHAMKAGIEARRSRNYETNLPSASGAFAFSAQATGQPGTASSGSGLASLLLGFPTGFTEQTTPVTSRSAWYYAAFAQDDWSLSSKLTLNFGLRWETDTPLVDSESKMNGFDAKQINPVSGTPGVVKFANVNGYPNQPYGTDWNNFGPRVGFAWKMLPHMALRGGYGLFFAHPFDGGQPTAASLGFSLSASLNSPDNGITAPFYLREGVPKVALTSGQLNDSFGAVPVGQSTTTAVTFFERNRGTGYAHQFNLSVQRELPGSIVIELSGLGNLGRKLPSSALSLNQIAPNVLNAAHQSQRDRPFPQFTNVSLISPTLGVTNYYAGVAKFEKRFSHGLNLVSTFTWSKLLGNTFDSANGGSLGQENGVYSNFYNRRVDYGPSENDIRRRFTFSSVYELPFGSGRRWLAASPLRYLVGGWGLGNLTTLQSGAPLTVITQTNTTNSFSAGSLRANLLRNGNLPNGERRVARWFDTDAFQQPAPFTFGTQGVNTFRADGLINLDFSVLRSFHFTERIRMQLRGEFFNTFNHTNFGLPGSVLGAPAFGIVSSSKTSRQIQVGTRFTF